MPVELEAIAPVLLVADLPASVAYWCDQLGFEANLCGEPPDFAIIRRDQVTLMLVETLGGAAPPPANWRVRDKTNQAYIWVNDVDALYREVQAKGATIDYTIYDTPWGTREFGTQDLDDHDITFGQILR